MVIFHRYVKLQEGKSINQSESINPSYFGVGFWSYNGYTNVYVCIYICIMDMNGYVNGFPWALKDLFNLDLTEDITTIELIYI